MLKKSLSFVLAFVLFIQLVPLKADAINLMVNDPVIVATASSIQFSNIQFYNSINSPYICSVYIAKIDEKKYPSYKINFSENKITDTNNREYEMLQEQNDTIMNKLNSGKAIAVITIKPNDDGYYEFRIADFLPSTSYYFQINIENENNISDNQIVYRKFVHTTAAIFKDISYNAWYYNSINEAYDLGLISGVGNGLFKPNDSITAKQLYLLCYKALGISVDWNNIENKIRFDNDLKKQDTFSVLSVININHSLTREQTAEILRLFIETYNIMPNYNNILGAKTINGVIHIPEFKDKNKISSTYSLGVIKARSYGYMNGDGNGYFNPQNKITRAEATSIILKMYKDVKAYDIPDDLANLSMNIESYQWYRIDDYDIYENNTETYLALYTEDGNETTYLLSLIYNHFNEYWEMYIYLDNMWINTGEYYFYKPFSTYYGLPQYEQSILEKAYALLLQPIINKVSNEVNYYKSYIDSPEKAMYVIDGMLASFIIDTYNSGADIYDIMNALKPYIDSYTRQQLINLVMGQEERFIPILIDNHFKPSNVDNLDAYYLGKWLGDIVSLGTGIVGTAKGVLFLIKGLGTAGSGASLLVTTDGATYAISVPIILEGLAEVVAGGSIAIASGNLALTSSSSFFNNFNEYNYYKQAVLNSGNNNYITVKYNGQNVPIYRGGESFTIKASEIRIDSESGLVKNTHGISINVDKNEILNFGQPHRIDYIPDELMIIQKGRGLGHFEIVPKNPMTLEKYQNLLYQIRTTPIK